MQFNFLDSTEQVSTFLKLTTAASLRFWGFLNKCRAITNHRGENKKPMNGKSNFYDSILIIPIYKFNKCTNVKKISLV
jgi:hypothetical protein